MTETPDRPRFDRKAILIGIALAAVVVGAAVALGVFR